MPFKLTAKIGVGCLLRIGTFSSALSDTRTSIPLLFTSKRRINNTNRRASFIPQYSGRTPNNFSSPMSPL